MQTLSRRQMTILVGSNLPFGEDQDEGQFRGRRGLSKGEGEKAEGSGPRMKKLTLMR